MKKLKPKIVAVGSTRMAKCKSGPCGRPCNKRAG